MASALIKIAGALLLWLWCCVAPAHPMPESQVWLDTTPDGMRLTARLPLNRLEFAFGKTLTDRPDTLPARYGDALSAYLLQHVGARSGGAGWLVLRPRLTVAGSGPAAELQAVFELRAPAGADPRRAELLYDVITHEVRTHRALVFLRNDWNGGFAGQAPLLLGELDHEHGSLPIVLRAGAGASVLSLFRDGVAHIAAGTDHLLFLLMLLLAAPLAARAGRWQGLRPRAQVLRHTAFVITAFTLGHGATLLLGGSGLLAPPQQAVEVAVAVTILVAALHAWRPLFARAEAWMALFFGLVHGMAFSASLSGAGLTAWQHGQALLAFNLGIESMQLVALIVVLPPLLVLGGARPALLAWLRGALAALAGAMSLAWIAQRLEWLDLPFAWLGDGGAVPLLLVAGLWLVSLFALLSPGARGQAQRA